MHHIPLATEQFHSGKDLAPTASCDYGDERRSPWMSS